MGSKLVCQTCGFETLTAAGKRKHNHAGIAPNWRERPIHALTTSTYRTVRMPHQYGDAPHRAS